ncbi:MULTISPECIES: electron transfer flavoprotein-ubiquinone oxidoreductase [Pseudoalteromonas]|uniref:electron transfer flavoprotein-ubiquinone oxidoreductase n=1 Tax=Pseudoalteromonas TaxID=53246 RepID=UPI0002C8BCCC|nr:MULTISPECIES: electron transfer flavoprotein-ubiquinone oxidoreductase [Pseudoalteromonas]MCP4055981.1 electron transfer flavoprotein-ubiquinone oxidoreductase [Pseudoalteromonas sp.]ENN99889.1 electron transfer flavoprotein-ubiquinone oxidoreductase [Pseudoalteromonas agarivorans S816]MDI3244027.1 electron transfer flavoprotein-ubiquinone oxidoreductase [Pseudoalteromonas agarivorans]TMS69655.1 electron transfer flavoprotein-ubiquinone oxidoreductase [Pseudoalteromonas sp. S1691]TMS72310.1
MVERETMEFDVVIVGAGPAGLASAIKLAQLAQEKQQEQTICVVEKGSEVGAHILSGAVFETKALDELLPNWQELGAPVTTQVTQDEIYWFNNSEKATALPRFATPKTFHNEGNYIVSMGNVCRWLAEQAENLGVEIFPGFSAHSLIIEQDTVKGIITGDMGVDKDGNEKDGYMPGMELRAKYTVFAEGCRGHLGKQLINEFALDKDVSPQHYGLGFKEIWQIDASKHQQGKVVHGTGWPLNGDTNGGSFMYHCDNNQVVVGLIVDLNYSNPHLSPFDEFQRMKHHPVFKQTLEGGERIAYGARAIAKGGLHSLPKMHFAGGLLIGCDAGTLNFAKIKGNHTAMKSGMVAADVIFKALQNGQANTDLADYNNAFENSWAYKELYQSRNFGPAMHALGKFAGGAYNTLDQNIFNGALPFTFKDNTPDYDTLKDAANSPHIDYPKPDGLLSFDKLSSVFLSNTNHEESQPCHLKLKDPAIPIAVNLVKFDEPAQRYCPAGVYEVQQIEGEDQFVINAQNCVHCKTCDIKDPSQNITWVTPEGAGGPNYPNM